FAAFCGGVVTTVFVYLLATKESQTDVSTMLLAGIAINALSSAGIGLFVFASNDQQVRAILFWLFGSLGGALWSTLLPAIPFILGSIIAIGYFSYSLNLYLLGEREASHLGVNVQQMKWLLILLVAMGVGSSVALSGIIAFVGLVVPHLLRLVIGPDNRLLLPASALLGGILLLGADVVARTIVSPTELPIGLLTSLLGSPFFLFLLVQQRRRVRL
ncbi:iron ABC transporter permease, partial [bacterium]|nr:iron ABC transporter permease [bacterium]